jgi:hypothetical protein
VTRTQPPPLHCPHHVHNGLFIAGHCHEQIPLSYPASLSRFGAGVDRVQAVPPTTGRDEYGRHHPPCLQVATPLQCQPHYATHAQPTRSTFTSTLSHCSGVHGSGVHGPPTALVHTKGVREQTASRLPLVGHAIVLYIILRSRRLLFALYILLLWISTRIQCTLRWPPLSCDGFLWMGDTARAIDL